MRTRRTKRARIATAAALGWACAAATAGSPARAGGDDDAAAGAVPIAGDPAGPQALGRVFGAGPAAPALTVLSTGGYGYTEAVLGRDDGHHRVAGSLAVEGRPLRWLDLALRVDGRYDAHIVPGQPVDDGFVGEPRLYVRADRRLGEHLRGGARFGVWLPGGNMPSIDLGAATPELVGALTYAPAAAPLWLSVNAGYRSDRSARSARNAATLSAGDRLALEVSAFDQALFGVAASYGAGAVQPFAEASCELLLGTGAPAASASPIRIGAGARVALGRGLRLEAEAEVSPSGRPDLAATAPLAPVPPRVAVWVGLGYRFGATARTPAPPTLTPIPLPSIELRGQVVSADGGALAGVRVTVERGPASAPVATRPDGRFTLTARPGEALVVSAEADGYVPGSTAVTPAPDARAELTITLARRLPNGQLRGLVRSLGGRPVPAEIRVDPRGRALRAAGGRFEIDIAPGAYEVTIAAPGFTTQRRRVQVEQNGVTLLDVDLRGDR